VTEAFTKKPHPPAAKAKDTAVCRVRQAIVNETLGLELIRFYEDSFIMEYGPRKQYEDG